MGDPPVQGWELTTGGRHHRVTAAGSFTRTITWHVDGVVVAQEKSSDDTIRLSAAEQPGLGALAVVFTGLGRPKRATWYRAEGDVPALARAVVGTGGIDLVPDPGSPAARREERIQLHPRRHTALAVAGGVATVVVPVLLGLLAVRLAVSIPWPDWDLPSIPWPDWDLPSIPWPDVDLPDWELPGWLAWLLDKAGFVWPVLLAWVLARREVRRRREQAALRARLAADHEDDGRDDSQDDGRDPGGV